MTGARRVAHPAGKIAAALDEVAAWLKPWVADQAEGAAVNDILSLLLETARDPSLLTWAFLAKRFVVHPQEFIDANRDRFDLREDGETWIIRHRTDGRIPLRLQPGVRTTWELVEPVIDDDALRAAARRRVRADPLTEQLGPLTLDARVGGRHAIEPRLMAAAIDRLSPATVDEDLTCARVEWWAREFFQAKLGAAVVHLVMTSFGLDVESAVLRADPAQWRVWLARRAHVPVATIAMVAEGSHRALRWIACAPGETAAARALVAEALEEDVALSDALTVSAHVDDEALADWLAMLGFRDLGPAPAS